MQVNTSCISDWMKSTIQFTDAQVSIMIPDSSCILSTVGESRLSFDIYSSFYFKIDCSNLISLSQVPEGKRIYCIDGQGVLRHQNTTRLGRFRIEDIHGRLTIGMTEKTILSESIFDMSLCMWATEGYGFIVKYYPASYETSPTDEYIIGYKKG